MGGYRVAGATMAEAAKVAYIQMQAEKASNEVSTHPCMCFKPMNKDSARWAVAGVLLVGIFVIVTAFACLALDVPVSQFDNKILYVTFHGDENCRDANGTEYKCGMNDCLGRDGQPLTSGRDNVIAYKEDGTNLGPVLDLDSRTGRLDQLRGVLEVDGKLVVLNSNKDASRVLLFGNVSRVADGSHRRAFEKNITASVEPNLNHPYGLAIDGTGTIFVSNQNSGCVQRIMQCSAQQEFACHFDARCFVLQPSKVASTHKQDTGLRGVAIHKATGLLYVARTGNGVHNGVYIYNTSAPPLTP